MDSESLLLEENVATLIGRRAPGVFGSCILVAGYRALLGVGLQWTLVLSSSVSGVPSILELRPSLAGHDLGLFGVTLLGLVLLGWHLSEEQADF